MKTEVENLSETRVKMTVELPFEELEDDIAAAYQKIGSQVQVPGFRRGRVPRQILDQRVGRGPILEEVVNTRVPQAYESILADEDIFAVGSPDVEVTEIADGDKVSFVAEVDIRPEFDVPEYKGLAIEVDTLEVSDEDMQEQLDTLRAQFGSYKEVERAVADGDVLLVDIRAEADGEEVEELNQTAFSYEVGEDGVLPGLDDAVVGANADDEVEFVFTPEFGEYKDKDITVKVTVNAVRERELPEVNDDFALLASEFDTVDELLDDLRSRLGRSRLMERGQLARNKAHDILLDSIDIPVPEKLLESQVGDHFSDDHDHGDEGHREEVIENARKSIKAQFILDKIAEAEEINVEEAELSQWLMMQAPQYGMSPDQFAQALVEANQVPTAVAEVRRGKALAVVLEAAVITDTNGESVDLKDIERALNPALADALAEAEAEAEVVAEAEADVIEAEDEAAAEESGKADS